MAIVVSAAASYTAPAIVLAAIAARWLRERAVPPVLGDVTLHPHQIDAAGRLLDLLDAHGGAMLADEPGLGKTFVSLAVARCLAGHDAILVVAPAALREMWRRSMAQAHVRGDFASVEALSRGGGAPGSYVVVIVDESHHVRNPRTQRYRALARLAWGARVLLLTATPLHNRLADLRAQFALFLGAQAESAERDTLVRFIVRRRAAAATRLRLPRLEPLRWLPVEPDRALVRAVVALPPAVPPADGGTAHALLRLGLLRAAVSSDGAVRAALRRRLARASALTQALESGRLPDRRELRAWSIGGDAVQLGFPELLAQHETGPATKALLGAVAAHAEGVRRALEALEHAGDRDGQRAEHLRALRVAHPQAAIVALTQLRDTAVALFRRLGADAGVALVSGRGAWIASGPVPRREIITRFARPPLADTDRRLSLRLLVATDVLSEGLDLQGASVLVHLDLPWTIARLEQRVGRLRRLGSAFGSIAVYAMGTPSGARECLGVMRTLHRKARLVDTLIGFSELVAHAPLLGARRRRRDPEYPDVAASWEAVRNALDSVRRAGGEPRALASVHRERGTLSCEDADPSLAADPPLLSVAEAPASMPGWRALALASVAGRPRLLTLSASGASEQPRAVLELVEVARRAEPGRDSSSSSRCLREALAHTQAWLNARRGERLVAPALEAPSRAHARALRLLDTVLARAARHERGRVAADVEECRHRVLAARGAGAELALDAWSAPVHEASARGRPSAEDLSRLRELLAHDASRLAPTAARSSEAQLLALLVLIPSPRGGDLGT